MKAKKYAIIDIETTGTRAARDRITEVAVVLFDGKNILDTWQSLINPETYIPYGITELTGITQEMVAEAPKFFEVARKIVEMTEGAIFTAHNVRFDYGFIREEFKRLGYTFSRKQLCTVRLSRKAFPGFASYSLGALIYQLDIAVEDRHRAMADAMATTELLEKILNREENEQEVVQLVNLGIRESLLPRNWTVEKIHSLPEACGVYYFHDEAGNVIYVGKSKNIRKRVATHFANKTEKARKLQEHAFDLTFELTGSELVALLLESHEIKRLRPPINRAQRLRNFPFVIHSYYTKAGYLAFDVTKVTAKTRKDYNIVSAYPKLFSAKGYLKRNLQTYELCPKLCGLEKGKGACFHYHLNQCHGACAGQEAIAAYNERAEAMRLALLTVFEEDLLLVDQGRCAGEAAVILIKEGACRGYSYVSLEELDGDPADIASRVRPLQGTPEMSKIIQRYLVDYPKVQKIAL